MRKTISKNYQPTHYVGNKKTRYLLGQIGKRNVLFVGVNPSRADDITPDPTIRKIIGFANRNGYDGWFIVNIYPQRSTNPVGLDMKPDVLIVKRNKEIIVELLKEVDIDKIVACWGRLITSRSFLHKVLLDVIKSGGLDKVAWSCIGKTVDGIPKHPSRHKYSKFQTFSLNEL